MEAAGNQGVDTEAITAGLQPENRHCCEKIRHRICMYGRSAIEGIRKKMTKEDRDEEHSDDRRGEPRPYAE